MVVIYYTTYTFLKDIKQALRAEGRFVDVVVEGEIYSACRVNCYVSEVGWVCVLINVKTGTRDVHFLCSDLVVLSVFELLEMALRRCVFEEVHK